MIGIVRLGIKYSRSAARFSRKSDNFNRESQLHSRTVPPSGITHLEIALGQNIIRSLDDALAGPEKSYGHRLSEIKPYRVMNAPDVSCILHSGIRRKHRVLQKDIEVHVLVVVRIAQRISRLGSGLRVTVRSYIEPYRFSPVDRIFTFRALRVDLGTLRVVFSGTVDGNDDIGAKLGLLPLQRQTFAEDIVVFLPFFPEVNFVSCPFGAIRKIWIGNDRIFRVNLVVDETVAPPSLERPAHRAVVFVDIVRYDNTVRLMHVHRPEETFDPVARENGMLRSLVGIETRPRAVIVVLHEIVLYEGVVVRSVKSASVAAAEHGVSEFVGSDDAEASPKRKSAAAYFADLVADTFDGRSLHIDAGMHITENIAADFAVAFAAVDEVDAG